MRKILFITTTNLAANPRLLKELRLAFSHGYLCTVIQFYLGNWSDASTEDIEIEFPSVRFINLPGQKKNILWLFSSLLEKFFRIIPPQFLNLRMLSVAISKRSLFLLYKLKIFRNEQFTWVVAHNPGSFYAAIVISKLCEAKLGIDIEDYHPGETNDYLNQRRIHAFLSQILPLADYCSYASPLIAKEVQQDIPEMKNHQIVLLNGFPAEEFLIPQNNSESVLKIVWFSQHIASERGLEQVIPVINKLYPKVELHLIGNMNREFEQKFISNKTGIVFHGILSQKELHQILSKFDIGLATDLPVNRNREIALTNKIFAYAQAGLLIAAMHTEAQDQFLQSGELLYIQMDNNIISIENALIQLYHDKQSGKINRLYQFHKATHLSWESISKSLMEVWDS